MKNRFYFNQRSISFNSVFNPEKVNEHLDKFKNIIENGWLITYYDEREICRVEISKVYYNFDFSNFSKSILSEIVNYFEPEKYSLKVASGNQEIRLRGGELFIDNERYEKMVSIVNSTDKSKALSMNVGLVKVDKDKYPKSYTILTSFTNKHYKSSLPDKIKSFSDNLINFNVNIDFHIKTIEDLKNKDVSLKDFVKSISIDKKNDKVIKSVELKLRALGKKLVYDNGYNFWNKRNNPESEAFISLSNFNSNNMDNISDFKVNCKVLYNAYVELFKDSDTSIIARESRRIIESFENI